LPNNKYFGNLKKYSSSVLVDLSMKPKTQGWDMANPFSSRYYSSRIGSKEKLRTKKIT